MLDPLVMQRSLHDAAKGKNKKKRRDVRYALEHPEKILGELAAELRSCSYVFHSGTRAEINESSAQKTRIISKPSFRDQIVHHILMEPFKPIVQCGLYEHANGSLPKRGPHRAKKQLQKWVRSYGNKRIYILKMDVRQFYASIDHNILKSKINAVIRDKRYKELLFRLIDCYGPGLPKGFYSSQWFANLYLKKFDHYVKQDLGVRHYLRYMDDMVILGTNKRELHRIQRAIGAYMTEELHLTLKSDWQVYRFVNKDDNGGRDIDMMGFRFYRNKTTLRKSILRDIRRKALRLAKKDRITIYDARSMLSRLGWTQHTNVYGYYQREIKPMVNKQQLRKKVSAYDRLERSKGIRIKKAR